MLRFQFTELKRDSKTSKYLQDIAIQIIGVSVFLFEFSPFGSTHKRFVSIRQICGVQFFRPRTRQFAILHTQSRVYAVRKYQNLYTREGICYVCVKKTFLFLRVIVIVLVYPCCCLFLRPLIITMV